MGQKIFLVVIILVAMFPGWVPKNVFPGPTLLSFISLTFLIFSALQWKKIDPNITRLSQISLSLLLFYGWGALGYFFTGSLDISYAPLVQYLGVAFLYFGLILCVKEETDLYKLFWIGLFCAGIHSLSVVYQILPTGWFLDADNGISHFRNKNIFSSYIIFFFPLAIFLSSYSSFKVLRYLARGLFVLLLVVFLFAGSRAGEGAVVIQLLMMTAYLINKKDKAGLINLMVLTLVSTIIYSTTLFVLKKISAEIVIVQFFLMGAVFLYERGVERVKSLMVLILVSTIILGAAIFISKNASTHLNAFRSGIEIKNNAMKSINIRIHFWQGTFGIIKDHWLTGTGLGTFRLIAPLYLYEIKDQRSLDLKSTSLWDPPSAHNLYLHIASESGVIGLCLFLVLIYFVFSKSYALFSTTARPVHEPVFYIAVSIAGYLLHNLLEFNWYPSEFIYTFTFLIFIVDLNARKYIPTSSGQDNLCSRSFPVVLCGLILIGGGVTLNYYFYLKSIKPEGNYINEKNSMWDKYLGRAKLLCPSCSDPYLVKGMSLLREYYSTLNPVFLTDAKLELDKTLQNNPLDLRALPHLIEVLALQGHFPTAKEYCYRLFKYQRYEFIAKEMLAIILLVESFVAKNPSTNPAQIVEIWKQKASWVMERHNRRIGLWGKAVNRENNFIKQQN